MTNLQRMKEAITNKPSSTACATTMVRKPVATPEQVIKKIKPQQETIKLSCGCKFNVKQLNNQMCCSCSRKARQTKHHKMLMNKYKRLPAGSVKHLEWNGTLWHGTLTIPDVPEPFWYESDTEWATVHGLHQEWNKWKKLQQ